MMLQEACGAIRSYGRLLTSLGKTAGSHLDIMLPTRWVGDACSWASGAWANCWSGSWYRSWLTWTDIMTSLPSMPTAVFRWSEYVADMLWDSTDCDGRVRKTWLACRLAPGLSEISRAYVFDTEYVSYMAVMPTRATERDQCDVCGHACMRAFRRPTCCDSRRSWRNTQLMHF